MNMFHSGQWSAGQSQQTVTNPFDGSVIDTVPRGTGDDIQHAVTGLVSGFGKEGPKSAIREMTEEKMVVLHLR